MKELRNDADYGYEELSVDINAMTARTETFIKNIDELLNS